MNANTTPLPASNWTTIQKIFFRFGFIYFLLYIFPFPVDYIPFANFWNSPVTDSVESFWHSLVPWIGAHILHLPYPITTFSNGSGDTTYDYVQLLTVFFLAVAGTIIWSLADRKRSSYRIAYFWLRLIIRYYLAYALLDYGISKIFYVQMSPPSLRELIQPLGDKSPMGLAWSYFGYSKGFNLITGSAEFIGGILILFRRTVTIGALLNVVVMGNVALINFCYDVPVKLYSSSLLLMSLFLLLPDVKKLLDAILFNRTAYPTHLYHPPKNKWLYAGKAAAVLFFCCLIWKDTQNTLRIRSRFGENSPKPPLYGLYNVSTFIRNKDTVPPILTDSAQWRNFITEFPGNAAIKFMNDSIQRYSFKVDTLTHSVSMYPFYPVYDTADKSKFLYQVTQDGLFFSGTFRGDSLKINLTRQDPTNFRLIRRGFHWINEEPYQY